MINKLDNKTKVTLRYAAYIIGWSIGLFFSAFLFMFLPEESDAHMSFAEIFEDSNNIIQNYVYPMVIIMLLFHWDAIYSTFSKMPLKKNLIIKKRQKCNHLNF